VCVADFRQFLRFLDRIVDVTFVRVDLTIRTLIIDLMPPFTGPIEDWWFLGMAAVTGAIMSLLLWSLGWL